MEGSKYIIVWYYKKDIEKRSSLVDYYGELVISPNDILIAAFNSQDVNFF